MATQTMERPHAPRPHRPRIRPGQLEFNLSPMVEPRQNRAPAGEPKQDRASSGEPKQAAVPTPSSQSNGTQTHYVDMARVNECLAAVHEVAHDSFIELRKEMKKHTSIFGTQEALWAQLMVSHHYRNAWPTEEQFEKMSHAVEKLKHYARKKESWKANQSAKAAERCFQSIEELSKVHPMLAGEQPDLHRYFIVLKVWRLHPQNAGQIYLGHYDKLLGR